ncbi:MAG TPA: dihydrofolate reductase family protein [Candidatus Limnocylindria bacterium]|nr:dihydrofolate reductase family protein [Candidatus Limnocylindria bacterium]
MLATLLERAAGDALPLSAPLLERYGGPLRFPARAPYVFANFVSTLDGIVSYDVPGLEAAAQVSGGHASDRFVLALLRAVSDAVVVGAGTLRKEPTSVWTPRHVFPDAAAEFAALRGALGLRPQPLTVVVSASGDLDLSLPAFRSGVPVVVATTVGSARRLPAPAGVRVIALAERAPLPTSAIVALAAREGGPRVLTEGGPRLLGQFLEDGALDELFLTIAPRLAGRGEDARRLGLVEGVAFTPDRAPRGRLVSVKSADDYLFTRFAFPG